MAMPRKITFSSLLLLFFLMQAQNGTIKITATDADGNVYQTVRIGNQLWTVENLKTTKYNNGTPIPLITGKSAWENSVSPSYCWYDNSISNKNKYGALYNWHAINSGKLAPKGWHVPTDEDWASLWEYLMANGYNWDKDIKGNKVAKSLAAKSDWAIHAEPGTTGNDLSKNNRSGFNALPAGVRLMDGAFSSLGCSGRWWSNSERDPSSAWYRGISYDNVNLYRSYYSKRCGFSVRLLRD